MKISNIFKDFKVLNSLLIISFSISMSWGISSDKSDQAEMESGIIYGKQLIHQGFSTFSKDSLSKAVIHFKNLTLNNDYSWLAYYYLGLAYYRLGFIYRFEGDDESAVTFLEQGIINTNKCLKLKPDFEESYVILMRLYENMVWISKSEKVLQGFNQAKDKAISLHSSNPRMLYSFGIYYYSLPEKYGGSKYKAIEKFEAALSEFDSSITESALLPDWGHDETYGWLARIYYEYEDYYKAKKYLDWALKINPKNKIISEMLKPNIEDELD